MFKKNDEQWTVKLKKWVFFLQYGVVECIFFLVEKESSGHTMISDRMRNKKNEGEWKKVNVNVF